MKTETNRTARPRSAFTLLELVIVIAIIGMLSSLLFFGIGGALRGVDVTRVKAEFTQLESAITQFESNYGVTPPSAIVLTENPGATAWDPVSKSVLRRMFGNSVDFTTLVDFNGDGDTTDVLTLTSSEGLLFFLGGMRDASSFPLTLQTAAITGFSANREKPFARGGDNRIDPQFAFDLTRLIDNDGDGMPEYRDLATEESVAMAFASSNNGQGYSDSNGSVIYFHQADGSTAWNENSFQLISPGADGQFGFGDPDSAEPALFETWSWSSASGPTTTSTLNGAPWNRTEIQVRTQLLLQQDNISNFAPGTMGQ